MVRYVSAACASSAVNFLANSDLPERKVKIRHVEWSDLDRIMRVDRSKIMELDDGGNGIQLEGMWGHHIVSRASESFNTVSRF
jgi:hypothetical protein